MGTSTLQPGGRLVIRPVLGTLPLKRNGVFDSTACTMYEQYSRLRLKSMGASPAICCLMLSHTCCRRVGTAASCPPLPGPPAAAAPAPFVGAGRRKSGVEAGV